MKHLSHQQIFMLEKGTFTCADVEKLYGDYHDGDLPETLRARVDAHQSQCSQCRQFSASYDLTVALAGSLRERPLSLDVRNRLRERLNKELGIALPSVK